MLKTLFQNTWLKKTAYAISTAMLSLAITHSVYAAPFQDPLFLTAPVTPIMMLNMSRDHQLYFKIYDDYADITNPQGGAPDGIPDLTYNNNYDYYGYFDSNKCYTYSTTNERFEPAAWRSETRACVDQWSGNFLNWGAMTRIDVIRKILYGGYRSQDDAAGVGTNSVTVLERTLLPNDTHSFAKFYNPGETELKKVVPASIAHENGITLCNTTDPASRTRPTSSTSSALSQNVTEPPLIKVAQGNYSLWANNERWQCGWKGDGRSMPNPEGNGNDSSKSGIAAARVDPKKSDVNGKDYVARVQVCVPGLIDEDPEKDNEKCRNYSAGNVKPIGLLQEFGENDSIHFGLITGSYSKNKSGGVLRKAVGSIKNEVNLNTGVFRFINTTDHKNGIIDTLNRLRIFGYNYADGLYNIPPSGWGDTWNSIPPDPTYSDNCSWFGSDNGNTYKRAHFDDGRCGNWGNPQAEIYLESLRYLAGAESATAEFNTDDSGRITGLKTAEWSDPISETKNGNYCAPLNVLQFNASTISYDADQLDGASDVGITDLTAETNLVADAEDILDNNYFVGAVSDTSTAADFELCTAKNVTDLAAVRGVCPEAPRLEGSYQIAGLAYHARRVGLGLPAENPQYGREKVTTYGVALAPATPSVTVNVSDTQSFTIMPACRSLSTYSARSNSAARPSNCAIVDFKIVEYNNLNHSGKLYVSWEDMEQGGDFDQDMWGTISYSVNGDVLTVTTDAIAKSSDDKMAFGYVISGTTDDGFKAHSGVNGFNLYGCNNCQDGDAATSATYTLGSSSAGVLKDPLYYAAKWGGYSEALAKSVTPDLLTTTIQTTEPSTYFYATDPRELERSIRAAFAGVASSIGTASAVSTSSTRLTTDSSIYQALFNSEDWSGELKILTLNSANEVVDSNPKVSTDNANTFASAADRNIVTHNPDSTAANKLVDFTWENLSVSQQNALIQGDDETIGRKRLSWLRGDRSNENVSGGMRIRKKLLGDIVNSSPVYSGNKTARYLQLPGDAGSSYATYTKDNVVYVGANDGMLHAFDATTLREIFAFIPTGVYSKLANITKPDYGMGANPHQYLVDGSLTVADYYTGTAWKTVLVGTLGAGGQGVFALDVTNPSSPRIIFERGAADGVGYVMGQPTVAQMKNGSWAVVFENGYENGTSKLFVVDLNNPGGGSSRVIDTNGGSGLSAVALLPNRLGQVEYAYAGDLMGNVWKFNLSSESSASWDSEKIFTAQYTSGGQTYNQPITGAPTLGLNPLKNNATMVYFGTGKYFDAGDNNAVAIPRQSFYALADTGGVIPKANLHQKEIVQAAGAATRTIDGERDTTNDVTTSAVDWTTARGWYLDFDTVDGERVITKPLLAFDRLIFTTLVPSDIACSFGGSSWLMELVAVGNRNIAHSILGDDANKELDNAVLGEMAAGVDGEKLKLIPCDITGDCDLLEGELDEGSRGRMSWRQLR